jgi:uncharacterized protein DUF1566
MRCWIAPGGSRCAWQRSFTSRISISGPLRYRDNGDGTITDLNTRLMWEKKSIDGSLHDVNLALPWSALGQRTIWDWLFELNTEGGKGFAGHSDRRIPNVRERQSLVDYSVLNSTGAGSGPNTVGVAPAFNTLRMFNGCTVFECSVTGGTYTSSTHTAAGTGVWGSSISRRLRRRTVRHRSQLEATV